LNGKLNFERLPLDLYLEQSAERAKTMSAKHETRTAAKEALKEQEKIDNKKYERERKADWRERRVLEQIKRGERDANGKLIKQPNYSVCTPPPV
jgi:hypothetical protein